MHSLQAVPVHCKLLILQKSLLTGLAAFLRQRAAELSDKKANLLVGFTWTLKWGL